MVHWYVRDNGHGHNIQANPMIKCLFLCLVLDPNGFCNRRNHVCLMVTTDGLY
jgi:hypothetical protein